MNVASTNVLTAAKTQCLASVLQVVKELQTSTGEAIHLLRAMIGEVCLNVEEEENAICSLFNSLQVK